MYNAKNKGRWFWQKASFTGFLKDDFNNFNNFMDKFSSQFRTMDEGKINSSLDEANRLLVKLVSDLEASMLLNRETDRIDILSYLDDNIKSLVDQSLKAVKS
jgi:predicted NUDIX family phosphoesterase